MCGQGDSSPDIINTIGHPEIFGNSSLSLIEHSVKTWQSSFARFKQDFDSFPF